MRDHFHYILLMNMYAIIEFNFYITLLYCKVMSAHVDSTVAVGMIHHVTQSDTFCLGFLIQTLQFSFLHSQKHSCAKEACVSYFRGKFLPIITLFTWFSLLSPCSFSSSHFAMLEHRFY